MRERLEPWIYDAVIGRDLYNRVVWGTSTRDYREFARLAVADASGPLLDIACGTAVFTADAYRAASRPIVLLDRSPQMLARAEARIGHDGLRLVQSDVSELEDVFGSESFDTIACFGFLHLVADPLSLLQAARRLLTSHGTMFATSLVAETPRARILLSAMQRGGQSAAGPRTAADLLAALEPILAGADVRIRGSMAYLTIPAR